jgi:deazaflavin-dependent oxidoreductase (nitroreductase family)
MYVEGFWMPLSRTIARTNRYWINPIARRLAGKLPPFLLVRHVGRRTGKSYETPIWAFRRGDGFVIALTYGPGTDWLRNLQAAGGGEARYARHRYALSNLRVVEGSPGTQPLPLEVRWALNVFGVRHFLHVSAERIDA